MITEQDVPQKSASFVMSNLIAYSALGGDGLFGDTALPALYDDMGSLGWGVSIGGLGAPNVIAAAIVRYSALLATNKVEGVQTAGFVSHDVNVGTLTADFSESTWTFGSSTEPDDVALPRRWSYTRNYPIDWRSSWCKCACIRRTNEFRTDV